MPVAVDPELVLAGLADVPEVDVALGLLRSLDVVPDVLVLPEVPLLMVDDVSELVVVDPAGDVVVVVVVVVAGSVAVVPVAPVLRLPLLVPVVVLVVPVVVPDVPLDVPGSEFWA